MTEEDLFWDERRRREASEYERRQRRRKTLPWNIFAGIVIVSAVIGLLAALGGCSSSDKSSDGFQVDSSIAEAIGWEWPLTVDEITVHCLDGKQLVASVDGTDYGLNGLAEDGGYPAIDPIWKDDPDYDGLKVSIGELIAYANRECGN